MSQLHQHAVQLAEHGLAVFPLKPGDKAPATKRGFKDATSDPRTVDGWWQGWPDQNIGIATGKASDVWVLDVDGEEGEASLRRVVAERGPLPETVEAITGKGRHIYFRHVEGIGCTAGSIGPGLDTRGDGGYVVAPPSLHPSGRRYLWSVDSAETIAHAPDWLVELARASKPAGTGQAVPIIPTADVAALIAKLKPGLKRRLATEGKGDRSKHSFGVMVALFDAGLTISDVAAISRVSAFAAKFRDRGDLDAEIGRVLTAWERKRQAAAADAGDDLARMNARFAVVAVGGKTRVLRFEASPARPGALVPVYSTFRDFKDFHDREKREIVDDETGEVKKVGLGTWWLKQGGRAQYDAVVFEPGASEADTRGKLNLWRGFAVPPVEGDCSLYLAHITDNICSGNDEHATYLLDWMAWGVQHPGERAGVAAVLRGSEGVGKGVAIGGYGELYGAHFVQISQASHLTGNFNAHLQACSVLFADEAFFAGDRRHENVLKAIITEPVLQIEPKGCDPFAVRNTLKIFMSSNNEFVVPAGHDARRYFVLDVSEAHKQDHAYFAAIARELASGGREALLHFLLNRDVSGFEIRKVPQTEALADQKARSRRGVDLLVEMLAKEGALPAAHGLYPYVTITSGEDDGKGFWPRARQLSPSLKHEHSTVIGNTLKRQWGCEAWKDNNRRGLKFPPLAELRAAFDAKHGPQDWGDNDDWGQNAGNIV